jgi:hypothetical protein
MRIRRWKGKPVALKRVCDITGTDRDVEICDVTIAGQTIKLDLAPAGADKLREFFGSVVTVRHPHADSSPNELAPAPASPAESEDEDDEENDEIAEAEPAQAAPVERETALPAERPARRGRRPASVKNARKKTVARRAAKPVAAAQATAEIREWARANGFEVGERGAIPGRIRSAYTLAHE